MKFRLKLCDYAAEDADITLQLWNKFKPQLEAFNADKVFYDIESPLIYVLAEMESAGVMTDTETLSNYSLKLGAQIDELEKETQLIAGIEFNLNSPKQLGEILFEKLALVEKPKKTKTGQYATNEEVLADLAEEHEIRKILNIAV